MLVRLGKTAAGALLAVAGMVALVSCAADQDSCATNIAAPHADATSQTESVRRPIPTRPLGSFPAPRNPAPPQPPIDLTEDGAVVWGTMNPEIIDTRKLPKQISADTNWKGPVRDIEEMLPGEPEVPRRPIGSPNALQAGGLRADPVARPGALFPGIGQTGWTPPDPTIAVGREHIVETVNMVVAFYTKSGTLQFSQNLDSTGNPGFFEIIGGGNFTFDPKCFYDHLTDRFVLVALEVYGSTESWISIAISDDGDPNGIWYKYRTPAVITAGACTYWWDYPGFGYDGQAYYVTGNLFGLNNGGCWGGAGFRIFNKSQMLAGVPVTYSTLRDPNGFSVQAAQHYGLIQTPFFVTAFASTQLRISSIKNPISAPVLFTTSVQIPSFGYPDSGAPNVGGSINTIDERIFNVVWRGGNMYAGHNISVGGKNVARWYQMRTNSWPISGSVTLLQSGNMDAGGGIHSFFPAIYTNRCADAGMVLGTSSVSTTPDIRVTGRKFGDELGSMGALTTLFTSPSGTNGRWGDYFGITVDPVDDTRFWFVGEYSSGGWGTYIGSFLISCPADFNCDGFVDGIDYDQFIMAFEAGDFTADYNHDLFIDGIDYDSFMNDFETLCP